MRKLAHQAFDYVCCSQANILTFFVKPLVSQTEGYKENKTLVIRRLLKDLTSGGTDIVRSIKVCFLWSFIRNNIPSRMLKICSQCRLLDLSVTKKEKLAVA